jgi:hypothetical protein
VFKLLTEKVPAKRQYKTSWARKVLISLALFLPLCQAAELDYPSDYRTWNHIKTGLVDKTHPLFDQFGGMHHVYVNEPALQALVNHSEYPDGSVLVFDLRAAVPFEGGITQGERKRLDVMYKKKHAYKSTGGWRFESFDASTENRIEPNVTEQCYACHESRVGSDYVFSVY